jgi:chaperonin GroES
MTRRSNVVEMPPPSQAEVIPLRDRIIVKRRAEVKDPTKLIEIPDAAKEKPQEGDVVAVGDGRLLQTGEVAPLVVEPGDRILFGKFSGVDVVVDGQEYLILREDEVLAIIRSTS